MHAPGKNLFPGLYPRIHAKKDFDGSLQQLLLKKQFMKLNKHLSPKLATTKLQKKNTTENYCRKPGTISSEIKKKSFPKNSSEDV